MRMGIRHQDQLDDISSDQPIGLSSEDMTLNRMNPDRCLLVNAVDGGWDAKGIVKLGDAVKNHINWYVFFSFVSSPSNVVYTGLKGIIPSCTGKYQRQARI